MRYNCAVIGLGNIGFRLSLDPKRKETWSHVDAYKRCARTRLIGAVEVKDENARAFKNLNQDIPVYSSIKDLFDDHRVDIVSICVPTEDHFSVFTDVVGRGVRAVFCEKPLSCSVKESKKMVEAAIDKKVILAVNYTRRWQASYNLAKEMIGRGKIGKVTAAHAFYPDQIYNMGSHLFDTLLFLAAFDPVSVSAAMVKHGADPALSGWIKCAEGIVVTFSATGKREDLVFEIDIVGREGRLRVLDNGSGIEWFLFKKSDRYSGYRELVPETLKMPDGNDRFVAAVSDIAGALGRNSLNVKRTGRDSLIVDAIIEKAVMSAKKNGRPQFFKDILRTKRNKP